MWNFGDEATGENVCKVCYLIIKIAAYKLVFESEFEEGKTRKTHLENLCFLEKFCKSFGSLYTNRVSTKMNFLDDGWVDISEVGLDIGCSIELEALTLERKDLGGHWGYR